MSESVKGANAGDAVAVRLLIADDDQDTLEVFARILEKGGGVVVTAVTTCAGARHAAGELAKDSAEKTDGFEVVVADARLPDGSGVEMARELKRSGRVKRVVIVSGDVPPAGALPAGVDAWLVKPVPLMRLREAVERLVGRG